MVRKKAVPLRALPSAHMLDRLTYFDDSDDEDDEILMPTRPRSKRTERQEQLDAEEEEVVQNLELRYAHPLEGHPLMHPMTAMQKVITEAIYSVGQPCPFDKIYNFVSKKWKGLRRRDGTPYASDCRRAIQANLRTSPHHSPLFWRDPRDAKLWNLCYEVEPPGTRTPCGLPAGENGSSPASAPTTPASAPATPNQAEAKTRMTRQRFNQELQELIIAEKDRDDTDTPMKEEEEEEEQGEEAVEEAVQEAVEEATAATTDNDSESNSTTNSSSGDGDDDTTTTTTTTDTTATDTNSSSGGGGDSSSSSSSSSNSENSNENSSSSSSSSESDSTEGKDNDEAVRLARLPFLISEAIVQYDGICHFDMIQAHIRRVWHTTITDKDELNAAVGDIRRIIIGSLSRNYDDIGVLFVRDQRKVACWRMLKNNPNFGKSGEDTLIEDLVPPGSISTSEVKPISTRSRRSSATTTVPPSASEGQYDNNPMVAIHIASVIHAKGGVANVSSIVSQVAQMFGLSRRGTPDMRRAVSVTFSKKDGMFRRERNLRGWKLSTRGKEVYDSFQQLKTDAIAAGVEVDDEALAAQAVGDAAKGADSDGSSDSRDGPANGNGVKEEGEDDDEVEEDEDAEEEDDANDEGDQGLTDLQRLIKNAILAHGGGWVSLDTIAEEVSTKITSVKKRDGTYYTPDCRRALLACLNNTPSVGKIFLKDSSREDDNYWTLDHETLKRIAEGEGTVNVGLLSGATLGDISGFVPVSPESEDDEAQNVNYKFIKQEVANTGISLTDLQAKIVGVLAYRGGSALFDDIIRAVSNSFSKMRRRDGASYSSDSGRAVRASLSSNTYASPVFKKESDDVWAVADPSLLLLVTSLLHNHYDLSFGVPVTPPTSSQSRPTKRKASEISTGDDNSADAEMAGANNDDVNNSANDGAPENASNNGLGGSTNNTNGLNGDDKSGESPNTFTTSTQQNDTSSTSSANSADTNTGGANADIPSQLVGATTKRARRQL